MPKDIFLRVNDDGSEDTITLDAVIEEQHTNSIRLTSNPVELGANINDHAIIEPDKILIRGVVTDTPLGFAALTQIVDTVTGLFGSSTSDNLTRSQQAYSLIKQLMNDRLPIEVQTGLINYTNMMITGVNIARDKDTSKVAIMEISLEQIIIVDSEVVVLSEGDLESPTLEQGSSQVEEGRKEATEASPDTNESVLVGLGKTIGVL